MSLFLNATKDVNHSSTEYNNNELNFKIFQESVVPSLSPSIDTKDINRTETNEQLNLSSTKVSKPFFPTFPPSTNSNTSSHFIEHASPSASKNFPSNSSSTSELSSMTASSILHVVAKYFSYSVFALSPIAAYLPQYWKLLHPLSSRQIQQEQPTLSGDYSTIKRNETVLNSETNDERNENNLNHGSSLALHPRTFHNHNKSSTVKNDMGGVKLEEEVFKDNPRQQNPLSAPPIMEKSKTKQINSTDTGGFSPSTTLILLVSHMWRLLYFYGCTTSNSAEDDIQYDLMCQSITMILMQFLLVHALVQQKQALSPSFDNPNNRNTLRQSPLQLPTINTLSPMSIIEFAYSSFSLQYKNFCDYQQFWGWDALSPYVIFWAIVTLFSFFICQFGLFQMSNDGDNSVGVHIIRNASVLLESSLPLPQFFQNYATKSTQGLSIVMVLAWISGDSMKFIYYFIGSADNDGTGSSTSGTPAIFYWGCLLCLFFDFLVGMQILVWYPTNQVRQWTMLLKRRNKKFKKKYSFETIDDNTYSNENVIT